jgi:hypothetical protein
LKKALRFQVIFESLLYRFVLNIYIFYFYLIGIKQIPNVINEGTPSEAKMTARPKPWEIKKQQEDVEDVTSAVKEL